MAYLTLQEEVYLTGRPIFTGVNAAIRQKKKVKQHLNLRGDLVKRLVVKWDQETVIQTTLRLLKDGVFESVLLAKARFPGLFNGPGDVPQRPTAATGQATACKALSKDKPELKNDKSTAQEALTGACRCKDKQISAAVQPTNLFPVRLPFTTQYRTLSATQTLLEQSCFEFGQKWLPQVLRDNGWDCSEAVELTSWTDVLAAHFKKLPSATINNENEVSTRGANVLAMNRIRHAAVHRHRANASEIADMIDSASKLIEALGFERKTHQIQYIHCELLYCVKAMNEEKTALEERLRRELQEIENQRAELASREKQAIATMLEDDRQSQIALTQQLDRAVTAVLAGNLYPEGERAGRTIVQEEYTNDAWYLGCSEHLKPF